MSLIISINQAVIETNNPGFPALEPGYLLSKALAATAQLHSAYYGNLSQWMGYTSRSASHSPNEKIETFCITPCTFQGIWTNAYRLIDDLNAVEKRSKEEGKPFFEGIAKIIRCCWFQNLVDMFNNVPYHDAMLYDDATAIYEDLIEKIDEGIASIKLSEDISRADKKYDIIWQGDKTKWIKLANTIQLRILIRQSEMPDKIDYVKVKIAGIVSEGVGFLQAGEDALIKPRYGAPAAAFFRAHQYAVNFYTSTNDQRLDHIYTKPAGGEHLGNWLGFSPNSNAITSGMGRGVFSGVVDSYPFVLSSESFFLQAEAAFRGWLTQDPKWLYESGILASFQYLEIPGAKTAAISYYNQAGVANVNWNDSPNKLRAIIMQKWVALNGFNAMEAWSEFRRTGFPLIDPPSLSRNVFRNAIPARALYPQLQYDTNGRNVKKQGNICQFDSKIFWMK